MASNSPPKEMETPVKFSFAFSKKPLTSTCALAEESCAPALMFDRIVMVGFPLYLDRMLGSLLYDIFTKSLSSTGDELCSMTGTPRMSLGSESPAPRVFPLSSFRASRTMISTSSSMVLNSPA